MTSKQVTQLTDRINEWYPGAKLGPALVTHVWSPALSQIQAAIAVEALKRYAYQQHTGYPPSVQNILDQAAEVEEELHRVTVQKQREADDAAHAAAWRQAYAESEARFRERPIPTVIEAVLSDAARDPWASGHVEMFLQGVANVGREAEGAVYCEKMAREDPEHRDMWLAEAAWYAGGRVGPVAWSSPMMRGDMVQPSAGGGVAVEEATRSGPASARRSTDGAACPACGAHKVHPFRGGVVICHACGVQSTQQE